MSNLAAVVPELKGRLTIVERERPKVGEDEILVKNAAISTCPVDWKMQENGFLIDNYPTVLGSDVSGVVEDVGSGVTIFTKGDRVTGFADVLASKNPDNGAFQQYTAIVGVSSSRSP